MLASDLLAAIGSQRKTYKSGVAETLRELEKLNIKPVSVKPFGRGVSVEVDDNQAQKIIDRYNEKNIEDEYFKDVNEAMKILPAWFIPRMMEDTWYFAIMLSTGVTIGIERIDKINVDSNGNIWLDVTMLDSVPITEEKIKVSPTTRTTATINASHIVMAFELADT